MLTFVSTVGEMFERAPRAWRDWPCTWSSGLHLTEWNCLAGGGWTRAPRFSRGGYPIDPGMKPSASCDRATAYMAR